jgi:hypothetical protein
VYDLARRWRCPFTDFHHGLLALTVEERTTIMKKKPAAKSKRRATRASTRDLLAKGKRVTGGREPTQHPAKVTVPDIKLSVSDGLA